MPNPVVKPIVSALSKALKSLADKGENVPLDRVEKRLETAGVRKDEIEAAGISVQLDAHKRGQYPTVTTRSGNDALTPRSILDLDVNRLDDFEISYDSLVAEETALFRQQKKDVLEGSDFQQDLAHAEQRLESGWHEQRIARLQLEIDNNNEYLRDRKSVV